MALNRILRVVGCLAGVVAVTACGDTPTGSDRFRRAVPDNLSCSIPESEIFAGQFRDAIPALTDPDMNIFGAEGTEAFDLEDRVVGVVIDGQPVAVPLNVFWWHEIVNLNMGGETVAITHCPLTGSSLAFDRAPQGGVEFGVSGLLYRNNLMMYDRTEGSQSLWPQMSRGARCGPEEGTALQLLGAMETTLGGWRALHPNTLFVTTNTGWERDYSAEGYPYGPSYAEPSSEEFLFPLPSPMDTRRPPKERALGVPAGTGGLAFPYGTLRSLGSLAVITEALDAEPFVVLWDAEMDGAMAYRPAANGQPLTLRVSGDRFEDAETGSTWNMAGEATDGPLSGGALEPVREAYVAYWFAWPLFHPDIEIWSP